MRRSVALAAAALLLGAAFAGAQRGADKPRLVAEKGKLRIVVDGQPAGTEEYQISSAGTEWNARGDVKVAVPGTSTQAKLHSTLRLSAQNNPLAYDWSLETDKKISGKVTFDGGTANVELRQEGAAPFTQQHMFSDPRVVILDNNFYHHYAILGRLFDWDKKGTQTFSVYIPQETLPGAITLESAGNQEVDGAKYDLLRLRTQDLEMFLFFDKQRLMRITVPGSKVMVVREQ